MVTKFNNNNKTKTKTSKNKSIKIDQEINLKKNYKKRYTFRNKHDLLFR